MPKVLNKHFDDIPEDAFYIGRPSKYGNPYPVAKYGREECVRLHAELITHAIEVSPRLLEEIRADLGGKDLVCHCAPLACHGDLLLLLANGD